MKLFVVLVMLVMILPGAGDAADILGCDVWLESGNVLMWAACRVNAWIAFNQDSELRYEHGFDV